MHREVQNELLHLADEIFLFDVIIVKLVVKLLVSQRKTKHI